VSPPSLPQNPRTKHPKKGNPHEPKQKQRTNRKNHRAKIRLSGVVANGCRDLLVLAQPTVYTEASPQALASATQYLADLDDAMNQGLLILKANELKDLSTHSQHFKTLRETGQAQFGRSVFEPLGHCASAGIFANSWWQAQVSTTRRDGEETAPGAIQDQLSEFHKSKNECLKAANFSTVILDDKKTQKELN
jgi:hypothetical protein